MRKNEIVYYNTQKIKVSSTAIITAGTPVIRKVTYPNHYDFVEKVALIPIDVNADQNFRVAFRKDNKDIVNTTHNALYRLPVDESPNKRFLNVFEPVKRDNELELVIEPNDDIAVGDELVFDFVMVMTTEENYSNRILEV